MNYLNKYREGFSLVEILTAAVVLSIVAGATYATFLSVIKLATASRNELEAHSEASRWLKQVEATLGCGNLTAQDEVDLNDDSSILQEDYTAWPFANKPNVSFDSEDAKVTYSVVEELDFGSHLHFKKVTVSVIWDEKI